MKTALTIAGSDSGGGAGIQADLKTFSAHQVFGTSVITAVTAQNTQGVVDVQDISPDVIRKQVDAVFSDIPPDAVKIGMVSQIETIETIADRLSVHKPKWVVLDPVMVSKSGYDLLNPKAKEVLTDYLLPLATIVTPNLLEAETLTGMKIDDVSGMEKAAKLIRKKGPRFVFVKGGHLSGTAIDVFFDGHDFLYLDAKRIDTKNTHGTGCTLSSAIAANLANGQDVNGSVRGAKLYITTAIENSLDIGNGHGPTHHFYELYKKAGVKT
ncbi:MAG TPA: bifunctional hydroxymethylpyrimidine kinase/phosphomethylpyrimidine kinase [Bacillales bacterium]